MNQTIKPFNDERVRKALTLGLDRYTASRVLYPIASLKDVGGLMRPGRSGRCRTPSFKRSGLREGHREESRRAKRLLAEAGYKDSKRS